MNARWGIALFVGLPLAILIALVLLLPRGGDLLPAPDERVVSRVPSPDGRRIATVAEIAENAPNVDGHIVRIGGEEAFFASGTKRVSVRWRDANTLEVSSDHARFTRVGRVDGVRVVALGAVR